MKVRIKDWDDAVKAALADGENWFVENNSIFGISRELGDWGMVVEGYVDGRYLYATGHCAYPMCVVDMLYDYEPSSDDVLRYGKIITDDAYASVVTGFWRRQAIRIRLISYNGNLYYHKMVDGDVVECRKVGRTDA